MPPQHTFHVRLALPEHSRQERGVHTRDDSAEEDQEDPGEGCNAFRRCGAVLLPVEGNGELGGGNQEAGEGWFPGISVWASAWGEGFRVGGCGVDWGHSGGDGGV